MGWVARGVYLKLDAKIKRYSNKYKIKDELL